MDKLYWDSCVWLHLIQEKEESEIYNILHTIHNDALREKVEIWTSALTYAEVFKKKINGKQTFLKTNDEDNVRDFLDQEIIKTINVDKRIGYKARELLQKHSTLKSPDAIHLASALVWNLDYFHTYDKFLWELYT